MLNLEDIKQLIKEIDQSSVNEFSYEKDDVKIKIKKSDVHTETIQPVVQQSVPKTVQVTEPQPVKQVEAVEQTVTESPQVVSEETGLKEIVSPMVGTFYRKPSPESDNYVNIGDKIDESTVVCIVEAMKLFNEIEAELTGEIVEVLVEDGELVEYGQPLFKVKTN